MERRGTIKWVNFLSHDQKVLNGGGIINDDWITSGRNFEYRYRFSSIRSIVLDGYNCKKYYNIICAIKRFDVAK